MTLDQIRISGDVSIAPRNGSTVEITGDFDTDEILRQIGAEECARYFKTELLDHFDESDVLSKFSDLKRDED